MSEPPPPPEDADEDVPHGGVFFRIRASDAAHPELPRTGRATRPREEVFQFSQSPYLEFAPRTVERIEQVERGDELRKRDVQRMFVYFMGLLGPAGPLPLPFTDYARALAEGLPHPDLPAGVDVTQHRSRPALAEFIDLFNHRFISLLYRAWADANIAVDYDRPDESRFETFLGSLIGLGFGSLRHRLRVPDRTLFYFSGHYGSQPYHAQGLEQVLSDYLGEEVAVEHFIGHWLDIPESSQCRLGEGPETGLLGSTIVIGSAYWDRQLRFRVRVGAAGLEKYLSIVDSEETIAAITDIVNLYTGRELFCELQPVLRREEVPELRMDGTARLGYTTWLFQGEYPRDADDLILELAN